MRVATVGEGTAGDVVTRQMIARGRPWRGGVEFTYLPRDAVGCITIWGAGPAMSRLEPSYLPRDAVGCITIWGAGPAMSRLEPSYLPRDVVGCITIWGARSGDVAAG